MENNNPLEKIIIDILNENGFEKLDNEAKATYLPQFMAQAEQRIGAALLPLLNENSAEQFVSLSQRETTPDEWWNFWQTNVPDFVEVVKNVIADFAAEVKDSMSI